MITPIATRGPAEAGDRHANWWDVLTEHGPRTMEHLQEGPSPYRIRARRATRWLGAAMMRALSSPRVRQAGSWPRFTRDGLL